LVKNQTSSLNNGIYVVTTIGSGSTYWKLTRADDYDDSSTSEVNYGDFTLVVAGNTNIGKTWIQVGFGSLSNGDIKIGTDSILWTQTSGVGTQGITGATGAGGVISNYGSFYSTVDQNATTGGEAVKFDSTNIQNGVTLVTNGTSLTRVIMPVTGTYLVDFAGQVAVTGPGNKQANFWLVKNGSTAVSTAFDSAVTDTTPTITAWTWQVNATAGDYYEVFWNATSTNVFLNAAAAASPVPAASGAVIRVSQVNYQGLQGPIGTQGATGAQGTNGTQGATGTQGTTGTQGATGTQGTTGTQGLTGAQGIIGTTGSQGTTGVTGSQGTAGFVGSNGTNGLQGVQGIQGLTGTGIQGASGTGVQGIQGITGTGSSDALPQIFMLMGA
jgi:hypothetical protein